MMMIILTQEQADAVHGVNEQGTALAPRPLADGTFALSDRVLSDPTHQEYHDLLSGLPRRDVAADEWFINPENEG